MSIGNVTNLGFEPSFFFNFNISFEYFEIYCDKTRSKVAKFPTIFRQINTKKIILSVITQFFLLFKKNVKIVISKEQNKKISAV